MKRPEDLVSSVYDRIFNLSLRFLGDPESAKDATQEICIRILEKIGTFRGEALFSTWAMKIATNYLCDSKKSFMENIGFSFEMYEADCAATPVLPFTGTDAERTLLAEELKHSCSTAMLQCLDRTDRLVYILHAFFAVSGERGASITGLTPVAYRKRLSRARARMAEFLEKNCGLYSDTAPCHCFERVPYALSQKRIDRKNRMFTVAMEELDSGTNAFRAPPMFRLLARETEIRSILSPVCGDLAIEIPAKPVSETN